jgi:hypothetical protein
VAENYLRNKFPFEITSQMRYNTSRLGWGMPAAQFISGSDA